MSADLHAALAAWFHEKYTFGGGCIGHHFKDQPPQCEHWATALIESGLLAAHPATDADLIREAEQRGAAAVVERVNALADEHEAHHFGYYGGCTLCRTQDAYAALRAAVRATEETPVSIRVEDIQAVIDARGDGDFSPILPKLRALIACATEETPT